MYIDTIYCFLFAVKRFHYFTSLPSFPEKLSRLPAFTYTSPIGIICKRKTCWLHINS